MNFPLPARLWCRPEAVTPDSGLLSGDLCTALNVFFTASLILDAVSVNVSLRSGMDDLFRNQGCCNAYVKRITHNAIKKNDCILFIFIRNNLLLQIT